MRDEPSKNRVSEPEAADKSARAASVWRASKPKRAFSTFSLKFSRTKNACSGDNKAASGLSITALIAAQRCLIPFDCDAFSRRALYTLLENVGEARADHNDELEVEGIVVNQFQPRASLPQKLVQELIDEGLPVLQPYLSSSVKIKESHQQARPMIHLDARHKLTLEMIALHDALAAQAA